jgi:hypothetical protein
MFHLAGKQLVVAGMAGFGGDVARSVYADAARKTVLALVLVFSA